MDYEAKMQDKLGYIAKTVGKLEDSVDKRQNSDSRAMRFFEQKKALHEIKSILRAGDDVVDTQRRQAEDAVDEYGMYVADSGFTTLPPTSGNKGATLDRINTQLMYLDDTLEGANARGTVYSYAEEKRTLHEIKKILHEAGQYDAYSPTELQGLEGLYSNP